MICNKIVFWEGDGMKIDSGLTANAGRRVREGDKVRFCGHEGEVIFEFGCLGVYVKNGIDYLALQKFMDEHEDVCCGNEYRGCENDNFISLWEIYENFNCIEDYLWMLEII